MLTPSRGRPYRRADRVGRRRGASLCFGGECGRGARGSRPGRCHEPRLHAHDRLSAASSHRQGEEWGEGARARGGRQGGHGGSRARGGRWTFACTGPAPLAIFAAVERLGAVAIDYRNEDFLARMRELTGSEGVDVVLDGFGGALSIRSFRALRPGGRLVVFGHSGTVAHGRKSWRGWINWYATTATVSLWGLLSPRRRVLVYRIQKLREGHQVASREPASPSASGGWRPARPGLVPRGLQRAARSCSARTRFTPSWPSACRCRTLVARMSCSRARRTRESSCSCRSRTSRRFGFSRKGEATADSCRTAAGSSQASVSSWGRRCASS